MEQKYTISRLLEEKFTYDRSDFIFFWKNYNNEINKQIFSQWFPSDFTVDDIQYNCAEQFMMAEKARLFNSLDVRDKILNETNPARIKKFGREVRNFNDVIWKKERFGIVVNGNIAKFSQNPELKDFMLSTEDKILVEASPMDRIWGIGMPENSDLVAEPEQWNGKNLLGFALMQVRDILKQQ